MYVWWLVLSIKLKFIFAILYTESMRKILLSMFVFAFLIFVLSQASITSAATRYASCDGCGFCPKIITDPLTPICEITKPDPLDPTKTVNTWPGDWGSCVKCLYPDLYPQGSSPVPDNTCKTLLINEDNSLVNPMKAGRQFTMLGCISSGTQVGFNNSTGASSFVQKLLDVIFALSGGLALLYLLYGAFIILTSQADPEKLNYGRRLIYGAIAGIIITMGSVFIVNVIGSGLLRIPGFSGATP